MSKSNLKSTTPLWNQFYINFMIFFLNFWDLQPISMWGFCLACLRSYPILAIFGPKRPSAASWAGLGCLKNNFPYYFHTTLAFGRCRQDCEKKVGPISLQWQSPWLLTLFQLGSGVTLPTGGGHLVPRSVLSVIKPLKDYWVPKTCSHINILIFSNP